MYKSRRIAPLLRSSHNPTGIRISMPLTRHSMLIPVVVASAHIRWRASTPRPVHCDRDLYTKKIPDRTMFCQGRIYSRCHPVSHLSCALTEIPSYRLQPDALPLVTDLPVPSAVHMTACLPSALTIRTLSWRTRCFSPLHRFILAHCRIKLLLL